MRQKLRDKIWRGNLRVQIAIDLDADELAMIVAGVYDLNGRSGHQIPLDGPKLVLLARDALALYGTSMAMLPAEGTEYDQAQHDRLAEFFVSSLDMRRNR